MCVCVCVFTLVSMTTWKMSIVCLLACGEAFRNSLAGCVGWGGEDCISMADVQVRGKTIRLSVDTTLR